MSVEFKAYERVNTISTIKNKISLFPIIITVIKLQRWAVITKIPRRQQHLSKLFKFNT